MSRIADPKASSEYDPDIGNEIEPVVAPIENSPTHRKKNKKVKF